MEKEVKLGNVQYYLRENPLSPGVSNRFMAAVKRKGVMRQDQIVTLMTNKNTTISREEIELVLSQLKQVVTQQNLAGYPVIMDLFKAQVTIKGGFTNGEDENLPHLRLYHPYAQQCFASGGLVSHKGAGLLPEQGDPEIVLCPDGSDEQIPVNSIYMVTDRDLMFNLPDGADGGGYRIKLLITKVLPKKEVEYKETISIG